MFTCRLLLDLFNKSGIIIVVITSHLTFDISYTLNRNPCYDNIQRNCFLALWSVGPSFSNGGILVDKKYLPFYAARLRDRELVQKRCN